MEKTNNFSVINLQSLQTLKDDTFAGRLRNESGANRDLIIGGLTSSPGSYLFFNSIPSAVDFAKVIELSSSSSKGPSTGTFQGFNSRFNYMPSILKSIVIQTNIVEQSIVNIRKGFINKSLSFEEEVIYSPVCDYCLNNNNIVFTKKFEGIFPVGKNNFISIPLVDVKSKHNKSQLYIYLEFNYGAEEQVSKIVN